MLGKVSFKLSMLLIWEGFGELEMVNLFRSEVISGFPKFPALEFFPQYQVWLRTQGSVSL